MFARICLIEHAAEEAIGEKHSVEGEYNRGVAIVALEPIECSPITVPKTVVIYTVIYHSAGEATRHRVCR